jgi:phosphoribosylamine-glycine ligase
VTAGGRVLGVTATAASLEEALDIAYRGVDAISFKDSFNRTDIGWKAIEKD